MDKCSGTLSQVSCPLVASPTERDQPVTFALPQGGFVAYSLLPTKTSVQVKYHYYWLGQSWTSTVTWWIQTHPPQCPAHTSHQLHPGVHWGTGCRGVPCPYRGQQPGAHIASGGAHQMHPTHTGVPVQNSPCAGLSQCSRACVSHGVALPSWPYCSLKCTQVSWKWHCCWSQTGPRFPRGGLQCMCLCMHHMLACAQGQDQSTHTELWRQGAHQCLGPCICHHPPRASVLYHIHQWCNVLHCHLAVN